MRRLSLGEAAPWFRAPTLSNPTFAFSSLAGRYVLLVFLPRAGRDRDAAIAQVEANRRLLNDEERAVFFVSSHIDDVASHRQEANSPRWFLDVDGSIARLFGLATEDGEASPEWILLDPSLRALSFGPLALLDGAFQRLQRFGDPDLHAGTPLHAPVLIVPRILETALCRRLIEHYESTGGAPSGTMREIGGRTVGVLDDFKKRRDASIEDEALRGAVRARVRLRLLPEILKAFQFNATWMERYIVACYAAEDGGYFRPHRDNTTKGTAHRRFACSINLNAEEFEGGDLRFPEFGSRTYRPPSGGAVVFSCSLLHEATPVTRGRRYAFLPFFYDQAAAKVREENLRFIGDPIIDESKPAHGANATAE